MFFLHTIVHGNVISFAHIVVKSNNAIKLVSKLQSTLKYSTLLLSNSYYVLAFGS